MRSQGRVGSKGLAQLILLGSLTRSSGSLYQGVRHHTAVFCSSCCALVVQYVVWWLPAALIVIIVLHWMQGVPLPVGVVGTARTVTSSSLLFWMDCMLLCVLLATSSAVL
jgi:hypothetical protein